VSVPRACTAPTASASPLIPTTTGASAANAFQPNARSHSAVAGSPTGGTAATRVLVSNRETSAPASGAAPKCSTPAPATSTSAPPTSGLRGTSTPPRASSRRRGVAASVRS